MATLTAAFPTLLDFAKSIDPDGKPARVAEILNQFNEILDDMVWQEGNLPTGHQVTVRKTIGSATFRLFNQGVVPRVSTTGQITETCAKIEDRSEIDCALAKLNGNTAGFRMQQQAGIIESFNQTLAKTLIYGDTTVNPERFNGIVPRYSTISGTGTTVPNVITAGGSTASAQTSIYLVGWSPTTVFGIFPKGSAAGLVVQDLGEQTIFDTQTPVAGRFQAFVTRFEWNPGLAIADWRYVVRICNIDVAALKTSADSSDTAAKLFKWMSLAIDQLFSVTGVRPVFYANQTVRGLLRVQLANKSNSFVTLDDWSAGPGILVRPTLKFMGYPVRRCDQILNTESVVS
jgi:hypothetical protein